MLSYASVRGEEDIPSTGEVDVWLAMLALLEGTYVRHYVICMTSYKRRSLIFIIYLLFCFVLFFLSYLVFSYRNLHLSVRADTFWIIRMAVWGTYHKSG